MNNNDFDRCTIKDINKNFKNEGSSTYEYDKALSLTGYGRFHYNLLAACALCLLSAGIQNGLAAYVLPSAQCELKLTSAQIGMVNVSFLIGGCLSSFLWGILADTSLGRRNILIATLFSDSLLTVTASVTVRSFETLLIFRLLNGFVIGAPGTLVFSYIGEFHTEKSRAKCICYVGFFYTLSWMLLPAIAWAIIPLPIEWNIGNFTYTSWRLYMTVIGLFALTASIWLCFLPPSPKLLLVKGHTDNAIKILRNMYKINTGKPKHTFPVKMLIAENLIEKRKSFECEQFSISNSVEVGGKTARILKDIVIQIRTLLKPPLLTYTSLTMFMMFANMFGYYGMGLWLPEFIKRFDIHYKQFPNVSVTVCDLFAPELLKSVNVTTFLKVNTTNMINKTFENNTSFESVALVNNEAVCNDKIETVTFINTLIMGAVCLFGNILSGMVAGCFKSRRILPITTAIIGGVTTAIIYWIKTVEQNVVVASICLTSFATGNMVLNSVIVDIFPTAVSALAVCTATFAGRFGAIICNLVFGLLLEISCKIPIFLVSAVILVSAIMGVLIPEGTIDHTTLNKQNENKMAHIKNKQVYDTHDTHNTHDTHQASQHI